MSGDWTHGHLPGQVMLPLDDHTVVRLRTDDIAPPVPADRTAVVERVTVTLSNGERVIAQQVLRDGEPWVAPLGADVDDVASWWRRSVLEQMSSDTVIVTPSAAGGPALGTVLPYVDGAAATGSSSGWSGSDTSHERALRDDEDGTTTARQRQVLRHLGLRGVDGATWKELALALDWHHGQASGALSNLHKAGDIDRLAEVRRSRCAVYVLPMYVAGRPTAEQGPRRHRVTLDHVADVIHEHVAIVDVVGGVGQPMRCLCGWMPSLHDGLHHTHHLLAEIAKGS